MRRSTGAARRAAEQSSSTVDRCNNRRADAEAGKMHIGRES